MSKTSELRVSSVDAVTTTFSSKPWNVTPQSIAAFEHGHAVTQLIFKGDMVGVGTGSYAVTYLHAHSGKKDHFTYSGQILFEGSIGGKKGTIIIRESGSSRQDRYHANWVFDTDSAAGELQGLAGEGEYDSNAGPVRVDQVVKLHVSFP